MNDDQAPGAGALANWQTRLQLVLDTMREVSSYRDPQEMVRAYGERTARINPRDRLVSLSRRGHEYPVVRVTRDSEWTEDINPWREQHRHPRIHGGLLTDLIYNERAVIINDLDVTPDDPGYAYLAGQRSLMALPMFDQGAALNMVLAMRREPHAFREEDLPENVWQANLFGRAVHNLVLSDQLKQAYDAIDAELRAVATIQRSLLPATLPAIPGLELAAHYQTSRRAGGDYYDVFPLADNQWGLLMADVSGHGTPAAVMMAITHSLAHTHPEPPTPPGALLTRLNEQLTEFYTRGAGTFVTAFYGIYDANNRGLRYASAGHDPPRLKRCATGELIELDRVGGLPLGVEPGEVYSESHQPLRSGDQIIFYTDGITEAHNPAGELFGTGRLDRILSRCGTNADVLIADVIAAVEAFAAGRPADDDRTLLIARVE